MTEAELEMPPTGFHRLFEDYRPLVHAVAMRVVRDNGEAEEVVQETFLRLYQRWPHLVIKSSMSAWLTRVALNLSLNLVRSRDRARTLRKKLSTVHEGTDVVTPEEPARVEEERTLVVAALLRLRHKDRACLVARHAGLSYKEVAEVAGVKVGSVGKLLARAEAKFSKVYRQIDGSDLI